MPTRAAVAGLVRRLRVPPVVAEPRRRWVPWVIGACAAAVLLGAGIAFAANGEGSPNVVGELGPWR